MALGLETPTSVPDSDAGPTAPELGVFLGTEDTSTADHAATIPLQGFPLRLGLRHQQTLVLDLSAVRSFLQLI